MSIKLKLVSCISAFILVLGIFIFGVLSAEQATVNLGGSISFDATDVYARVTGQVQHAQSNPTLQPLEFSADNDNPDQSSWSGLELQFDSRATNITIEVTVENLSMERTLTVNLTDMMQTSTDNLRKTITLEGDSYVSGTNETIPVATSNDSATNTSKVTFIITFDVIDHNRSLPSTDFDYDINLMDENYEPVYEILEGFRFDKNGVLLEYTGNEPNVVIPSSYSIIGAEDKSLEFASYDEFNNWVPNNFPVFYSMLNITVIVDGTSYGTYPDFASMSTDDILMTAMQNATQSIIFEYQENISVVGQEYTVTGIGMGAFMSNNNLESIIIPEGVTSIGTSAFPNCTSLKSITIPSSVTSIGAHAFQSCINLTSVDFGENSQLTIIDYATFQDCYNLTSVDFGENRQLISIENGAFSGCLSLTSITIPASVTTVEDAFSNCYALAEVYNYSPNITVNLGETFSGRLGQYAKVVYNSSDLTEGKPTTRIRVEDDVQYYDDGSSFIALAPAVARDSLITVSLDINTTELNRYAFAGCTNLTSITIPSSVESIGQSAFSGCSSLTSITIPENVTSIGAYAFLDCSSLTSITIDSSYAYQNADGGLSRTDNYLLQDANTVRVNVALVGEPGNLGFEANEYLNANFSYNTTPVNGYYIFTRNQ